MNRAEFLATATAAAATASPSPHPHASAAAQVTAEITLQREGDAPLAPLTVGITLHNTGRSAKTLEFPTADLYRIDILRDGAPVWSSLTGHAPIPISRHIEVPPGTLRLAQVIHDGTTDDKRAFGIGRYVVRVAMLGTNFGVVVDKPIVVEPALTCAEAVHIKPNVVVSVEGEPYVEGGVPRLRDQTGSLRLSHGLGIRPSGRWIVRGFADAAGDEHVFDVGRFAPAFDNYMSPTPKPVDIR